MKIKVNIKDLAKDNSDKETKIVQKYSSNIKGNKSKIISPELDLRGLLADDAIKKTDKYIDDAYIAHLNQVTIIHGKGTGALRTAIHSYLKSNTLVKSFRLGEFGEGDAGVTVVVLK